MSEHHHDHEGKCVEKSDDAEGFGILELAIRELCIEKHYFSAEDHRRFVEFMEGLTPNHGARIVAKAWTDPEFKKRLLEDATKTCLELGIDWMKPTGWGTPSDFTYLYALEDTPKLHNAIVCTLCSCYPRPILGIAPSWYERSNYRRRMVRWPRSVLAEFGTIVPEDVEVRIHDSNAKSRFFVIPLRPAGTEGWTEDQLAKLVTRDTMIGVSFCNKDWTVDYTPGNLSWQRDG